GEAVRDTSLTESASTAKGGSMFRRTVAIAITAMTVAGLTGAVAGAVSADGSPVVHACYSHPGGRLRLGSVCRSNERAVSWSQAGPGPERCPGATGSFGPSGAAGAT